MHRSQGLLFWKCWNVQWIFHLSIILAVTAGGRRTDGSTDMTYPKFNSTIALLPSLHGSLMNQMGNTGEVLQDRGYDVVFVLNQFQIDGFTKKYGNKFRVLDYTLREDVMKELFTIYSDIPPYTFKHRGMYDLATFVVEKWNQVFNIYTRGILESTKLGEILSHVKEAGGVMLVDGTGFPPDQLVIPFNYSIPFITMSSNLRMSYIAGIPDLPSVNPSSWLPLSNSMDFFERCSNAFIDFWLLFRYTYISQEANDLLKDFAPKASSYRDIYDQALLKIFPSDHHLGYPGPSLPDTLFLPGISSHKINPLPRQITEFIGKSDFVIISFGSMTTPFSPAILADIVEALRNNPGLKFIWRSSDTAENDEMPSNVLRLPWLPQEDLLAHPNAKVFVHHCGNSGQHEAAYHGVPMIGFALFSTEQHHNCMRVEKKGLSKTLDITSFTSKDLEFAIQHVAHDSNIHARAKTLSAILKSLPTPPVRAADAVEHVLQFGSDHLKGVAGKLPFYQLYMLDIFLCGLVSVVLAFMLLCVFPLKLFRACFKSPKQTEKIKSN